jgi:hypothetical protein
MRSTLIVAGLLLPALTAAQTLREREERLQDHRKLRQDHREARDDSRDLEQIQKVLIDFDAAREKKDWARLSAVDARVRTLLKTELKEGRVETAREQAEAAREQDQGDRRDDHRDLRQEAKGQDWRRALALKWKTLEGKSDPASLDRKRALLVEFDGLTRSELAKERQKRSQDLREIRDDRH